MAHPGSSKRQKELARQEKRRLKEEKRIQRKREKAEHVEVSTPIVEDPDIAGIVPGPQPPYEG
jgi:hypothetical protein